MAPDLTLTDEAVRIARSVGVHFAKHEQHSRDRAAADLLERAARLRSTPFVDDPLTSALLASCHSQEGLVHSHPSIVAAVAYEAVAMLLAGDPTKNEEEENRDDA
jgi:hypothetical protein